MATQNLIQIKRSETTATPTSLADGELAFSGNGDILFVGNFGSVLPIAGARNPGVLTANQALVANSTSGIDKVIVANLQPIGIYANGSLGTSGQVLSTNGSDVYWADGSSGSLSGLSDTSISTPSDGAMLFYDTGTGNWIDNVMSGDATITDAGILTLTNVNNDAGSYGSSTTVPSITIDSKGRITDASSVNIDHDSLTNFVSNEHIDHSSVAMTAGAGLTGGGDITASRTFNVGAGVGITVAADSVSVKANNGIVSNTSGVFAAAANGISVDASGINVVAGTGVVSNTSGVFIGQAVGTTDDVTFNDVTVSGNLAINGTLTTVDTTNLVVEDPLIKLAKNNTATDTVDIGFYGLFDSSGSQDLYAGLFRDASDGKFRLFTGLQAEPTTTVNISGTGYTPATLVANIESASATITGGTITGITDLAVADGGTGASSFTTNGILYGNGTGALQVTGAGTQYKVLQAGAGGVPEFADLDGGTF